MAIGRLADHRSFKFLKDVLDVRGWRVYDVTGLHTGLVEDLVVDTETGQIHQAIMHFEGIDHEIPFASLTLDRKAQQVHIPYSAATLRDMPTVPGWHPVDRHRMRATFLPNLAHVDDWGGEVEIEDLRGRVDRPL